MTRTPCNTPRRLDDPHDDDTDLLRGPVSYGRIITTPKRTGGGYDTSGIFDYMMQHEDRMARDWRLMGGNPKTFTEIVQPNYELENFLVSRRAERVAANSILFRGKKKVCQMVCPQVEDYSNFSKSRIIIPKGKSPCKGNLKERSSSIRPRSATSRQNLKLLRKLGLPLSRSMSQEDPYQPQEIFTSTLIPIFYPPHTEFATIPSDSKSPGHVPAYTIYNKMPYYHQNTSDTSTAMTSSPIRMSREAQLRSLDVSNVTETSTNTISNVTNARPTKWRETREIRPLAPLQGRLPSKGDAVVVGPLNSSVANICNSTDSGFSNSNILSHIMENNSHTMDKTYRINEVGNSSCYSQPNEASVANDIKDKASSIEERLTTLKRENLQLKKEVTELKCQLREKSPRHNQQENSDFKAKGIYSEKHPDARQNVSEISSLSANQNHRFIRESDLSKMEATIRAQSIKAFLTRKAKVSTVSKRKVLEQKVPDQIKSLNGQERVNKLRWFDNDKLSAVTRFTS
eukprot:Tbor_TRINITY_DN4697_c0_g1::TRINITY_DN4697_c0_g1_i1::g.15018::m.15018